MTLEEDRDFLLRSLRDLEDERAAGDLDDADYTALKDEYTAKAAAVLRQLESPGAAPPPLSSTDGRPAARSRSKASRGRVVAAAFALAVVSGGAGYAVAQSSGERLAGEEATGDLPEGSVDRISKAQLLVSQGKILDAVRVYEALLDDDPENPVALAQKGWLLVQVGEPSLVEAGLASIDRAIAAEPTYSDAYFFRGMTLLRAKRDPALAREAFEQGLATNPPPDTRAGLEQGLELVDEAASATP